MKTATVVSNTIDEERIEKRSLGDIARPQPSEITIKIAIEAYERGVNASADEFKDVLCHEIFPLDSMAHMTIITLMFLKIRALDKFLEGKMRE